MQQLWYRWVVCSSCCVTHCCSSCCWNCCCLLSLILHRPLAPLLWIQAIWILFLLCEGFQSLFNLPLHQGLKMNAHILSHLSEAVFLGYPHGLRMGASRQRPPSLAEGISVVPVWSEGCCLPAASLGGASPPISKHDYSPKIKRRQTK